MGSAAWKVMFSSPVFRRMRSLTCMLSHMKRSRKGSLSLNHDDTSLVNEPSKSFSAVNSGNTASSRFSNSENVLRGKVLKTTAKAANSRPKNRI